MSRNASGAYTLPTNSFAQPVAGTAINPTDAATTFADVVTEITDSLCRSGKGSMLANLSMGGFAVTTASSVQFAGSTSGFTVVQPSAIASGTLTLPAATDTLIGKATTDTLTNKTLDTAGTGNVLKINGTTVSDKTGTGKVVLDTSPTLVTPLLGTPTSGTLTNCTGLPLAGLATQAAYSITGNFTGSSAVPTASTIGSLTHKVAPATTDLLLLSDEAASHQLKYATITEVIGAVSSGVTSIAGNTGAFTLGTGLTNATNDIRISVSTVTNTLGADVNLNNTANFFDGPSCAQGTSGTWLAVGQVLLTDASAAVYTIKLWDGTTVIASAIVSVGAGVNYHATLSGIIASPAANIRISVKDGSNTTGKILFNNSGLSKDSTLTVVRIA